MRKDFKNKLFIARTFSLIDSFIFIGVPTRLESFCRTKCTHVINPLADHFQLISLPLRSAPFIIILRNERRRLQKCFPDQRDEERKKERAFCVAAHMRNPEIYRACNTCFHNALKRVCQSRLRHVLFPRKRRIACFASILQRNDKVDLKNITDSRQNFKYKRIYIVENILYSYYRATKST